MTTTHRHPWPWIIWVPNFLKNDELICMWRGPNCGIISLHLMRCRSYLEVIKTYPRQIEEEEQTTRQTLKKKFFFVPEIFVVVGFFLGGSQGKIKRKRWREGRVWWLSRSKINTNSIFVSLRAVCLLLLGSPSCSIINIVRDRRREGRDVCRVWECVCSSLSLSFVCVCCDKSRTGTRERSDGGERVALLGFHLKSYWRQKRAGHWGRGRNLLPLYTSQPCVCVCVCVSVRKAVQSASHAGVKTEKWIGNSRSRTQ
jgi:hypothetical protein